MNETTNETNEIGDNKKLHAESVAEQKNEELGPKEQEKVSGGAFDAFLRVDGIPG